MSKVTYDREMISPTQAREYLEVNGKNRVLTRHRVTTLADAIARGEWIENGETIKFNEKGALVDGQHRLSAIAAGSKSVPTGVARGLSLLAQITIDTGRPRSAADILRINDYTNAPKLASVTRNVLMYESTGKFGVKPQDGHQVKTTQQILAKVESTPELEAYTRFADWFTAQDRGLNLGVGIVGAAFAAFEAAASNEDALDFFGTILNSSEGVPGGVLRKRLHSITKVRPLPELYKAAFLVKAWNAYITGQRLTVLKFSPGGAHPEAFPTVLGEESV